MPLYAWKCPKCGHRFEVLCSIEKSKEAVCEKCGEKAVRDYTGSCSFGAKGGKPGTAFAFRKLAPVRAQNQSVMMISGLR